MLTQIKILTYYEYLVLLNEPERWDGFYNKEILESFESFINFELSVLFDNGYIIEDVTPTCNTNYDAERGLNIIIVYKINIENKKS